MLLVTLFSAPADAASRYVDNSGSPACSNSPSAGSEAQPWCTINYGVTHISSGDDLYVKQGTYREDVFINGPAGSANKPTVIRTYPGHAVTIRGAGNTGRTKITTTSYITFDGFIVTNFQQGIFVEGGSHHITIQNCTVHDVGQEAIHIKEHSSFVTIQGCTIYDTMKLGGCCNGEGIYVGTSSSGPLDNTNNVTIRNNIVHDTTSEGIEIKPGTHDCLIEGNEVYNTNTIDPYGAIEINQRDSGPQTWVGNPNHLVRNNIVHDNKTGIRLGTGSTAYNNIVYNTAASYSGIRADNLNGDSFPRRIYHNTVHMTSNGITNSGATVDIRNNIGTSATNNLPFNAGYFVNATARDYHLVADSAPSNAGIDLTSVVAVDKDGNNRSVPPDLGAYELVSPGVPPAPSNLTVSP